MNLQVNLILANSLDVLFPFLEELLHLVAWVPGGVEDEAEG
jgi:hypothetical protein